MAPPLPLSAPTFEQVAFRLYQAVIDPAHLADLILVLGSWLSENDEPFARLEIEKYSEVALRSLEDQAPLIRPQEGQPADFKFDADLSIADQIGLIEQNRAIDLHPDDRSRIIASYHATPGPMIFRYFVSDRESANLGTARPSDTQPDQTEWFLETNILTGAMRHLLERDFGITPAEMRVLAHALDGFRATEIAAALGKSPETIRSQLKALAAKVSADGQPKLIANIHGLATHIPQDEPHKMRTRQPEQDTPLHDGSVALFVHCALHGPHLPARFLTTARKAQISILAPSRPGYGTTPLDPAIKAQGFDGLAHFYAAYLKSKNVSQVSVLTHGTGLASAYRLAVLYPEIVVRLVGLDCVPPATGFQTIFGFKGHFRSVGLAMHSAPKTFDLLGKLTLKRLQGFKTGTKPYRRHILYPDVPLATLESPDGLKAMQANAEDLVAQDLAGCLHESKLYGTPWDQLEAGTNVTPNCHLLSTEENPLISDKLSAQLAGQINARHEHFGATFPFLLAQTDRILNLLRVS